MTDEHRRQPTDPLRHRAFWQAAGEQPDGSDRFLVLTASLLVLRVLDRWVVGLKGREVAFQELVAVQQRVDALPDSPIRRALRELLAGVGGARVLRPAKMIVLGQLLEDERYWLPAADVYATSEERIAQRATDRELLPYVLDRQAHCVREAGRLDKAAELYDAGISIANELQDLRWSLKLRVHRAILEGMHRGDLPGAERQLKLIIEDAQDAGLPDMVAYATHERGQVAYARDQDLYAAHLFYTAAVMYVDPNRIEQAELDLAVVLSDLGHVSYARTICELVRSASNQSTFEQRTLAGINLLRLALLRGDRLTFERLRQELAGERMKGRLLAHYHLIAGQGLLRFDQIDEGRAELQRTIEVAEAFKINQLVIRAEALLKNAHEGRHGSVSSTPRQDPVLTPILRAIDERRGPFAGAVD